MDSSFTTFSETTFSNTTDNDGNLRATSGTPQIFPLDDFTVQPDISIFCSQCNTFVNLRSLGEHRYYHRCLKHLQYEGNDKPETVDNLVTRRRNLIPKLSAKGHSAPTYLNPADLTKLNSAFEFVKADLEDTFECYRQVRDDLDLDVEGSALNSSCPLVLAVGNAAHANGKWKTSMEDRRVFQNGFGSDQKKVFIGVYDGYNGNFAADMAATELHNALLMEMATFDPQTACSCLGENSRCELHCGDQTQPAGQRAQSSLMIERIIRDSREQLSDPDNPSPADNPTPKTTNDHGTPPSDFTSPPDSKELNTPPGDKTGRSSKSSVSITRAKDPFSLNMAEAFRNTHKHIDTLLAWGKTEHSRVRWSGCSTFSTVFQSYEESKLEFKRENATRSRDFDHGERSPSRENSQRKSVHEKSPRSSGYDRPRSVTGEWMRVSSPASSAGSSAGKTIGGVSQDDITRHESSSGNERNDRKSSTPLSRRDGLDEESIREDVPVTERIDEDRDSNEIFEGKPNDRNERSEVSEGAELEPKDEAELEIEGEAELELGEEAGSSGIANETVEELGAMHFANAGNVRAILVRANSALELSKNHSSSNHRERKRVEKRGCWLSKSRRQLLVNGILPVTRGLGNHGDPELKRGVIAAPHTASVKIDQLAQFVVIATHGVWQVLSTQEVASLMIQMLPSHRIPPPTRPSTSIQSLLGTNLSQMLSRSESSCIAQEIFPQLSVSRGVTEGEDMASLSPSSLDRIQSASALDDRILDGTHLRTNPAIRSPEPLDGATDKTETQSVDESCLAETRDDRSVCDLSLAGESSKGPDLSTGDREASTREEIQRAFAQAMAERLVQAAILAGSKDNITVSVVLLPGCGL